MYVLVELGWVVKRGFFLIYPVRASELCTLLVYGLHEHQSLPSWSGNEALRVGQLPHNIKVF